MIIDLAKIPVMWATCEKTVDARKQPILDSLGQVGVTTPEQIDCPITNPYYLGLAIGHVRGLNRHKPPFMMMEDDANLIVENKRQIFEVPDDTDALYLGTTTYGRYRKTTFNDAVISSDFNDDYFRPYNMLALHAVVYLSKRYVDHVLRMMDRYFNSPIGYGPEHACDNLIADTMHHWNVLACKKPVFFQNDGKANICTVTTVSPTFTERL